MRIFILVFIVSFSFRFHLHFEEREMIEITRHEITNKTPLEISKNGNPAVKILLELSLENVPKPPRFCLEEKEEDEIFLTEVREKLGRMLLAAAK